MPPQTPAADATAPTQAAPVVPEVDPAETLEAAYRKEFAFLEAERRSLAKQLADVQKSNAERISASQATLDAIESEVVRMTAETSRLETLVLEAERQAQANADASEILEATFLQASTSLKDYDIERLDSDEFQALDDGNKIQETFALGQDLLRKLSSVRTENGEFYLQSGQEVSGEILRFGNIAAYGKSAQGGGALAPAGGGRLKVWQDATGASAEALFAGQSPEVLDIFLFESLNTAIESKPEKTVLSIIQSGGAIGWVIVALGGLALLLIVLRILFLRSASKTGDKMVRKVGALVQEGKIDEALDTCNARKGATARVLAAALRNLDRDREHMEDVVSEAILHEQEHLNRFGAFILVIAAVAPLLGLLGTVTGMISTFDVITEFGTGDPKMLAGGIAIALVTTELGLIVAIPTLLIGNLLSGWSDSIQENMEKSALKVINLDQKRKDDIGANHPATA